MSHPQVTVQCHFASRLPPGFWFTRFWAINFDFAFSRCIRIHSLSSKSYYSLCFMNKQQKTLHNVGYNQGKRLMDFFYLKWLQVQEMKIRIEVSYWFICTNYKSYSIYICSNNCRRKHVLSWKKLHIEYLGATVLSTPSDFEVIDTIFLSKAEVFYMK